MKKYAFISSILGLWFMTFVFLVIAASKRDDYKEELDGLKCNVIEYETTIDSLSKPVIRQQENINKFIKALAFVESSWNDSIVNPNTDAVGYLQITPIYVDQLNEWGYNYTYEDRFDRYKSIEMFKNTNKILNPEWDLHLALVIHNGRASYAYHQAVFDFYNKLIIDE